MTWDPQAYERVSRVQTDWGTKLVERVAWRGDEVVLDAGCGPGTLTEVLLSRVPRGRVYAVDQDPGMVDAARHRLSASGGRAQVVVGDVATVALPESVDVIFSNAALHWVPDHDQAFAHFLQLLKPGGNLVAQCGGEGNLEAARTIAAGVMKSPPFAKTFARWDPPWHYEDDASTTERLLITGFVHPEVTLEPMPARFASEQEFRAFLEAVVLRPYLNSLPDDAGREGFVKEYLARWASSGRPRELDYVRLSIRAQRPPHH